MKYKREEWNRRKVSPLELLLDPDNARIDVPTKSQDVIVHRLVEKEDVLGLANQIAEYGGLFNIETIMVWNNSACLSG